MKLGSRRARWYLLNVHGGLISLGQAPGGCCLAGATYWGFLASNLHPASDRKTASQSGKQGGQAGFRLPGIGEVSERSRRSYYGQQLATAWSEAWSFSKAQLIASGVAVGLAFGLAVVFGDAPGDIGSALVYPLAGLGLVWVAVFLGHLVSAPVAEANKLTRDRAKALKRMAELETPPDDPDPRIALANSAEHRAAGLRAIYRKRQARMGGYSLGTIGEKERAAANTLGEALKDYEAESVETRNVFDELVAMKVMDPEHRGLIEDPRHLDDLSEAAEHMVKAARRLRAEPAPEPPASPVELLQRQLDKALTLRGILSREVPAHWEGDALVPDDPEAEHRLNEAVFTWASETYDLLRKPPFTRYADDFWGEELRNLDRGYLHTVYGMERDKIGGNEEYLDRRIELLKRILEAHGG